MICADDVTGVANLPSSVKYPGKFVSLSSLKFKLLMSTIHRSPLADDKKTGDDDRRHTSTMTTSNNNDGSHTTTNLR
eukprot:scaffold91429_cov37-Cyclotella_meneghiniana.AAC.2